jgi:hypothetical protein
VTTAALGRFAIGFTAPFFICHPTGRCNDAARSNFDRPAAAAAAVELEAAGLPDGRGSEERLECVVAKEERGGEGNGMFR